MLGAGRTVDDDDGWLVRVVRHFRVEDTPPLGMHVCRRAAPRADQRPIVPHDLRARIGVSETVYASRQVILAGAMGSSSVIRPPRSKEGLAKTAVVRFGAALVGAKKERLTKPS